MTSTVHVQLDRLHARPPRNTAQLTAAWGQSHRTTHTPSRHWFLKVHAIKEWQLCSPCTSNRQRRMRWTAVLSHRGRCLQNLANALASLSAASQSCSTDTAWHKWMWFLPWRPMISGFPETSYRLTYCLTHAQRCGRWYSINITDDDESESSYASDYRWRKSCYSE